MPESVNTVWHAQQEVLTEEIQDVISYRPHWIVRRGNTIFLVIVLLLLSLTWIISYPDIVKSSARLTALHPPRLVNARVEGKLVKLLVGNEQEVKKDQPIGYMESIADYEQVIQLQRWIQQEINITQENVFDQLMNHQLPVLSRLGELQGAYQGFQNQLEITKQTLASGYYQQKKGALQKDLQYLDVLKKNTQLQQQLQLQDQELQQKEYEAYEQLAKEKVIAPLELNQYKSRLLGKEQGLEQLQAQVTNSEISSHGKQKEILDLQKQMIDQRQQFRSSLLELKSEIERWIQQYVLTAPDDGRVLYVSTLQENQYINTGQALFFIQPEQSSFYVEMMAGQRGLGKIRTGQKVMLRVEGYPSEEFGYLPGTVTYISTIPSRMDSFLVKAELQAGLTTNYNKTLFFRNGLTAQADIITDNRRLIDRLAGQLKEIWER